ncbi:MAG: hypothetical protein HN405_00910 [Planctomycetes bacterium]|jgi:hypothetical protein|nr:hypothetical protein [Planctomycetota bacterium]MBT4027803.1 hypothetical protein [Planctomycetota bacterium]MBT4560404.1 hypothetical protein [Planctomycetota bacterium]MBT7011528.1 hypothetical protein [Planctomycetota bacterium]MBT7318753.1 hypothetical protein [Planctomycetota bacterium]
MAPTAPSFGSHSPFLHEEQCTICDVWSATESSNHSDRVAFLDSMGAQLNRIESLADSLALFPPVLQEQALGKRRRSLSTLVDLLVDANDADFDMFLPTRAIVNRSLVLAKLNLWRLLDHIGEQVQPAGPVESSQLGADVDKALHRCIYGRLTAEVLGSLAMDADCSLEARTEAVRNLVQFWDRGARTEIRGFYPLLEAIWAARRKVRLALGTLLGVSEIMRLLQAGCDPQFVEYFAQSELSEDERMAFHEFLIGVPTEQIHSLEQFMEKSGRTSLSPEEAGDALGMAQMPAQGRAGAVAAYRFYRVRYLQAAARRIKSLPGPTRTAEEYMMVYYLKEGTKNA